MIYDLDKTQEWLNRTLAVSKAPPVRGGRSAEPYARRQTGLSIAAALAAIAAGMFVISWTRGDRSSGPGRNIVEVEGHTRVSADLSPPPAVTVEMPATVAAAPARYSPPARWAPLALDGNVVPLPGHTAPPAPVWLDGGARLRR